MLKALYGFVCTDKDAPYHGESTSEARLLRERVWGNLSLYESVCACPVCCLYGSTYEGSLCSDPHRPHLYPGPSVFDTGLEETVPQGPELFRVHPPTWVVEFTASLPPVVPSLEQRVPEVLLGSFPLDI